MDVEKLCMGCMKELEQPGVCPHCGYQADATMAEGHYLKPYSILNGKYLVGRVLGEGGFGITYIGYDLNLEMPVAIKEFYPNGFVTRESRVTSIVSAYQGTNLEAVSKWKNNFIREARTLAKCSHLSGVVGVKDFFEENGTAYIAMEYLNGETLKNYVKNCGGKVEIVGLLKVLEPVMVSLAKVHEYGLIHRDISPDNIMILPGGIMKLLDFGAARDYASEGEKSLSVMLKPGYAPEEQYRTKGKQGPWSDVYAFAATIYKCITGVTPPESMERLRKDELKTPSELGITINPQIENALLKGMEVYAEKRYQSMTEFKNAIYEGLQYGAVAALQVMPEQPALPAVNQQTDAILQSAQNPSSKPSEALLSKGVAVADAVVKQAIAAALKLWKTCRKHWIGMAVAAGVLVALIIVWAIKVVIGNGVNADVEQTAIVEAIEKAGVGNNLLTDKEETEDGETVVDVPESEDQEPEEEIPEVAEEDTKMEEKRDETGIHTYELIVEDVTWSQAYQNCLDKGGYLVRINSDEEYLAILQQIVDEDKRKIKFWLGGARSSEGSEDYRWVYEDGTYGDIILNEEEPCRSYWLSGEPSYSGGEDDVEMYMNMFYVSKEGRWVWNDVADDLIAVASFYAGTVGYICEYE